PADTVAPIVVLPAPVTPSVAAEELFALFAIATVAVDVFPGWYASTPASLVVSATVRALAARRFPTPGVCRNTVNASVGDTVLRVVSSPESARFVGLTCICASLELKPVAVAVTRTPWPDEPSPPNPATPVPTSVRITP